MPALIIIIVYIHVWIIINGKFRAAEDKLNYRQIAKFINNLIKQKTVYLASFFFILLYFCHTELLTV